MTPTELAKLALSEAETDLAQLRRVQVALEAERAAARLAGDIESADRLNDAHISGSIALRFAEGHLTECREQVDRAERALREARNSVADLSNQRDRLIAEIAEHEARLATLAAELGSVLARFDAFQQLLSALEPEPPPAEPSVAPAEPAQQAPTEPTWQQPARAVSGGNGAPQYFDRHGNQVDAWGHPIDTAQASTA